MNRNTRNKVLGLIVSVCLVGFACQKKEQEGQTVAKQSPEQLQQAKQGPEDGNPAIADPDIEFYLNFGTLYHRYHKQIQNILMEANLPADPFMDAKQIIESLGQLSKLKIQGKITDQNMELAFHAKGKATVGKYSIPDPQLGRFLPEDSMMRMQLMFPPRNPAVDTKMTLDRVATQLTRHRPDMGPLVSELLQKWENVVTEMEIAISIGFHKQEQMGIPQLSFIMIPKNLNQTMDQIVETVHFLEKYAGENDLFSIEEKKVPFGKAAKEVRHLMIKSKNMASMPGVPFLEIIVFENYVIGYLGDDSKALQGLVTHIESGKGTPLLAMNRYPQGGVFYADVNILKIAQMQTSFDKEPVSIGLTDQEATWSMYINNDPENMWFKMQLPTRFLTMILEKTGMPLKKN